MVLAFPSFPVKNDNKNKQIKIDSLIFQKLTNFEWYIDKQYIFFHKNCFSLFFLSFLNKSTYRDWQTLFLILLREIIPVNSWKTMVLVGVSLDWKGRYINWDLPCRLRIQKLVKRINSSLPFEWHANFPETFPRKLNASST